MSAKIIKTEEKKPIAQKLVWDNKKIKLALKNLGIEIHSLKKAIRQPNILMTDQQYWALTSLKSQVTLLCVIRASQRKKIHFQGFTLEQQDNWLKEEISDYEIDAYSQSPWFAH